MIKRRIIVLILTLITSSLLLALILPLNFIFFSGKYQVNLYDTFAYIIYIFPVLIIYGLPVSILIEYLHNKYNAYSLLFYLLFGAIPFLVLGSKFGIISLVVAIVYFIMEKLIKFPQ